jgi:LysM repeat protein
MRLATQTTILLTVSLILTLGLAVQTVTAAPLDIEESNLYPKGLGQADTPVPLSPVITNTPNPDGIITHIVQYGETLYTIAEAYGVPIDQILRNSGLSPTTTEIREGQELLIQTAQEPTPTDTPTPTEDPGTPTPTQPRPTMTPFPTRTPAPTFTPTPPPSLLQQTLGRSTTVGIGLILVCGLGLILVIYWGFLKKS